MESTRRGPPRSGRARSPTRILRSLDGDLADRARETVTAQMEILDPVGALRRVRADQVHAVLAEHGHRREQRARFEAGDRGAKSASDVQVSNGPSEVFVIRGDTSLRRVRRILPKNSSSKL